MRLSMEQVGLLNVDGYYDSLLALFDKGVEEGFIDHSARQILVSANTALELIKKMEVSNRYIYIYMCVYVFIDMNTVISVSIIGS